MPLHDPDEDERQGLIARLLQGFKDTGSQIATGAGLLDRGMRFVGENPLDFLPGTGEAMALQDARQSFDEGDIGMGLLALAGVAPGIPGGMGKIFRDLPTEGIRVFARSSTEFAVPSRRVVVITRNTTPDEGAFRASILEETREGIKARGHVHGGSEDELVDVISGKVTTGDLAERAKRAGIVDMPEIPLRSERRMELAVERNAERELMRQASEALETGGRGKSTGLMQKLAEGRKLPGGVGGFFDSGQRGLLTTVPLTVTGPSGQRLVTANNMLDHVIKQSEGGINRGALSRKIRTSRFYREVDVPIRDINITGTVDPALAVPTKGPIILDKSGEIIDGRHRLAAARANGDETIRAFVPFEP